MSFNWKVATVVALRGSHCVNLANGWDSFSNEIMNSPLAAFDFKPGELDAALEFLKRARWELRALRKVHVYADRLHIFDINGDYFEVRGVGYPDADIVRLLRAVNTAFDPKVIHQATTLEYKEFLTGRRYTWAQDRVM